MKQALIDILSTLKYPVFLEGSNNPAETYPDAFFTFFNVDTEEDMFYSGAPHGEVWRFRVWFVATDPALVETVPEQARQALRAAGWTLVDMPRDGSTDLITHTARFFTTLYLNA
jgi:hypothetical protein